MRDFGQAKRGWLGVKIQQVTPDIAESMGLKEASGALVASVEDGGPAAVAKLRGGDIILKFDGQDVKEMHTLPRIVAETAIGREVPVTVWRDGQRTDADRQGGELPDDQKLASAAPDKPAPVKPTELAGLGLTLAPITPEARDRYQLGQDQKGVLITDVAAGSPAAERGLKPGDVILEVQQQEVNTPGRRGGPGRPGAQDRPQVGADADPGSGRPALGAALAHPRGQARAGLISRSYAGPVQGQRTSGGKLIRIASVLPPVFRPNRVPRS